MTSNPRKLYEATQTLFRAFHYLLPRMKGGGLALPQPMNPEALAGCILHGCMSRVVREIQAHREQVAEPATSSGTRMSVGPVPAWLSYRLVRGRTASRIGSSRSRDGETAAMGAN